MGSESLLRSGGSGGLGRLCGNEVPRQQVVDPVYWMVGDPRQDLTQILRLCLAGPFDTKTAGAGLLRLLARAADVPDFATLDATLIEMQAKVRASFVRILGKAP